MDNKIEITVEELLNKLSTFKKTDKVVIDGTIEIVVSHNLFKESNSVTPRPMETPFENPFDTLCAPKVSQITINIPKDFPKICDIDDLLDDVHEICAVAKDCYEKSKKIMDGIPYGMLKQGVNFALDEKLFNYAIRTLHKSPENARSWKKTMYASILNANEHLWKEL